MRSSRDWFQGFSGPIREGVELRLFTYIRIGGPAEIFLEPRHEADVALAVRTCRQRGMTLRVLGAGSNTLVPDEGVAGAVMSLRLLGDTSIDGRRVTADAGTSLPSLLRTTRHAGLAGLETLVGIPASVGGAVAMNAGTRQGETFDHLVSVRLVDATGAVRDVAGSALAPRYRDGGLDDRIVVAGVFELRPDDPESIRARTEEALRKRSATQPVAERSLGCVFRNPAGDAAGRLVDAAGLKGERVGGCVVSDKHANYFVNQGHATARDVRGLMERVRARVRAQTGVELEPEIRIWEPGRAALDASGGAATSG
jgi:UDP-N-acetylmuramate dehydrogenase